MNLLEYVDSQGKMSDGRRRRCKTCNLDPDLLNQVHAARSDDTKLISYEMISKWLEQAEDIKIQPNTIRNHFVAGHQND